MEKNILERHDVYLLKLRSRLKNCREILIILDEGNRAAMLNHYHNSKLRLVTSSFPCHRCKFPPDLLPGPRNYGSLF